ncbi:MAG: hypothetical protein IPJ01_11870 [Micavibrio sp.]|nr:hypothetical protein [Micavibrio sp.]
MKKAIIIIGVVGAIGIGVGLYLYKNQNKLSDKDFDGMINLSKNKGYDVFEDISPRELGVIKNNYMKSFNRELHNEFMNLLSIGEATWSASQKVKFNNHLNKILKGLRG